MKILVTGGCGFIGSHITDLCVEAGHDVTVVDNLSTGKLENLNPGAKLHRGDVTQPMDGLFREGFDVVYHEAAQIDVQTSIHNPCEDLRVNIGGSVNVLEHCRKYGVKKVIYASSAAVYGIPRYLPVDEEHPVTPLSAYGISKFTPEHYLRIYRELYGLRYTILRYANVYGVRQDPKGEGGVVSIFTDRLLTGGTPVIFGDGEQTRDFIYVRDVAKANLLALQKGDDQVINVSTGRPVTINGLLEEMNRVFGTAAVAEHRAAREGDIVDSTLSNQKAKELLGFTPGYPLENGLQEIYEYYR